MTTLENNSELFLEGNPLELFALHQCLGEGTYGSVWKAKKRSANSGDDDDGEDIVVEEVEDGEEEFANGAEWLAIKVMRVGGEIEEIMKEARILKHFDSDFVVKYYGSFLSPDEEFVWIVMEVCDAGSVNDLMFICDSTLTEPQIKVVVASVLLGLEYIHEHDCIHRDIKAGNILLTSKGAAKIADFGVSALLENQQQKRRTAIGAPYWMAPEVIQEEEYDGKADIWSLGITMIEMADSRPPLSHVHPMRALFMIPYKKSPSFSDPEDWSDEMNEFLSLCLMKDPEQRPSASDLLSHPFVKDTAAALRKNRGRSGVLKTMVEDVLKEIDSFRDEDFGDEEGDNVDIAQHVADAIAKTLERQKEREKSNKARAKNNTVKKKTKGATANGARPRPKRASLVRTRTRKHRTNSDPAALAAEEESKSKKKAIRKRWATLMSFKSKDKAEGFETGKVRFDSSTLITRFEQEQLTMEDMLQLLREPVPQDDGDAPVQATVMTEGMVRKIKELRTQVPKEFEAQAGEEERKSVRKSLRKSLRKPSVADKPRRKSSGFLKLRRKSTAASAAAPPATDAAEAPAPP